MEIVPEMSDYYLSGWILDILQGVNEKYNVITVHI